MRGRLASTRVFVWRTEDSKIFASVYALFCGLVLVGATGLVLAPILHRMLHKFHLDDRDFDDHD